MPSEARLISDKPQPPGPLDEPRVGWEKEKTVATGGPIGPSSAFVPAAPKQSTFAEYKKKASLAGARIP